MNTIQVYLEKLGLSDIESKLYLNLVETGATTVLELSKKSKLKRATVHFNIENLIQKGLVTQVRHGARRQIIAEPPENLNFIIQDKKEKMSKLKLELTDVLEKIHLKIPRAAQNSQAEIKYFEGRNAVKNIFDDVLKAKDIRSYVNASEVDKVFPENADLFIDAINSRKDMSLYEIIDDSPQNRYYISQMESEKYHYKFFPDNIDFSAADIIIFDGKVANINLKHEISGFVISNHDYYDHSKAIFDFVWKMISKDKGNK